MDDAQDSAAESRPRRRDLITTVWAHLADERRTVLGLGILAVAAAQVESLALVSIAFIADALASGTPDVDVAAGPVSFDLPVVAASLAALAAVIVAAALVFIYGRQVARASARLERHVRDKIMFSYADADWEFQSTQRSSRIQGRLRLMGARSRAFAGLVGWIRATSTVAVFIVVAAAMSPMAALIIVAFSALLSLAVLPIRMRTRRVSRHMAEAEVRLVDDFGDAIDQGANVHVFGAWPAFTRRFGASSRSLEALRERSGKLESLLPVVYQNGALALILLIMLIASVSESSGNIGSFAAAALLLLRSVQYGQMLQRSLHQIAGSVPTMEVLQRELEMPQPRVTPGTRSLDRIERIELRGVGYEYSETERPALSDVSLSLRPGVIVGLAGPSGSGKSTLAQILLRLRWPTSGQYLINGRDVAEYSVESWTRLVSHLPQEPHLLHGTMEENVTFLDDSFEREQVKGVLANVGLLELAEILPDGLDTEVGQSSRSLSGGQIQRLGIARALLRRPRLIVLDEPTSALDINAERIVGKALSELRRDPEVLVVVIAHRASTLALCDEIVVLQDGLVAAAGGLDDVTANSDFLSATWVGAEMTRGGA